MMKHHADTGRTHGKRGSVIAMCVIAMRAIDRGDAA